MNYITNKDHISTAALHDPNYLSHGISWGSHRYVRREGSPGNYRYIYPEDLRNVGQNLVSGAKNLVTRAGNAAQNASQAVSRTARNAGQAVGRAIGTTQRASYNRAYDEHAKWRNRDIDWRYESRKYDDPDREQKAREYVSNQRIRSGVVLGKAQEAYKKTPLGMAENLINDADLAIYSASKGIKKAAEATKKTISSIPDATADAVESIDQAIGDLMMRKTVKDLNSEGYEMVSRLKFSDILRGIARGQIGYTIKKKNKSY